VRLKEIPDFNVGKPLTCSFYMVSHALTPALSLREREKGIQLFEGTFAGIIVRHPKKQKTRKCTPSPGGEGRGEGEILSLSCESFP
jgi:hypothetical protein